MKRFNYNDNVFESNFAKLINKNVYAGYPFMNNYFIIDD